MKASTEQNNSQKIVTEQNPKIAETTTVEKHTSEIRTTKRKTGFISDILSSLFQISETCVSKKNAKISLKLIFIDQNYVAFLLFLWNLFHFRIIF